MTDDRLITAIGRLERALSRIEARSASPALTQQPVAEGEDGLRERHLLLRTRAQAMIDRLDRLLDDDPALDIGDQGGNGAAGGG